MQKEGLTRQIVRRAVGLLFVMIVLAPIGYYLTPWKHLCFRIMLLLCLLLPVGLVLEAPWAIIGVKRMESPCRRDILQISIGIVWAGLLAAFNSLFFLHVIPMRHLPWCLPLGFLAVLFAGLLGHGRIWDERNSVSVFALLATVVGSATLTWVQALLVIHLDTWLFLNISGLPIPLLGITIIATGLVTLYSMDAILCAGIFHTLRRMLAID